MVNGIHSTTSHKNVSSSRKSKDRSWSFNKGVEVKKITSNHKIYKQINKYLIQARINMHKIRMTNIASKLKRVWRKMNVCLCVYNLDGMSEEPCF